jgi:hypothetical protein
MSEERRRNPRVAVELPVRVVVAGRTLPGRLKDLCRDAALVEVHGRCEMGTPVRIGWETRSGAVEVSGRVIRLALGEGDAQAVAILFGDVPSAAATQIELLIDRRHGG